ncbi:MAG: helix-turn-helix domain-containing protein [archaeon]
MAKVNQKSGFPDVLRPEMINSSKKITKRNQVVLSNSSNSKIKQKISSIENKIKRKQKSLPEIEIEFAPVGSDFGDDYALPIMRGSVKHVPTKRSKFKVVVRKVERPFNEDFEHQLAWICSSLGFFEPIDKEKNAAAVFKELVLATENGSALTSTAIAERIGMSRGAVINHLNNLLHSGLVEKNGHFYSARSRSMKRTIEEIEDDVERIFSQLKKAAEGLDRQIGFDDNQ